VLNSKPRSWLAESCLRVVLFTNTHDFGEYAGSIFRVEVSSFTNILGTYESPKEGGRVMQARVKVILQLTVVRPVCLGGRHPSHTREHF
jgi:hypothetical protein